MKEKKNCDPNPIIIYLNFHGVVKRRKTTFTVAISFSGQDFAMNDCQFLLLGRIKKSFISGGNLCILLYYITYKY